MQRYFVPGEQFTDTNVTIAGDDAHHLLKVMRVKTGDRFICCDGAGRDVLAEAIELGKDAVVASIVERLNGDNEPPVQVWIAQGLPKGDKMETVIQKNTEIGAARFVPFVSERTIVQYDGKKEAKRLERWRKIAKEAAEQSHRSRIPAIDEASGWKRLLQLIPQADAAFIAYERERGFTLKQALKRMRDRTGTERAPGSVLLVIGPEGGFTEREVAEAEAAGCVPVSLGKTILRTETAAMVGLTCILYEAMP